MFSTAANPPTVGHRPGRLGEGDQTPVLSAEGPDGFERLHAEGAQHAARELFIEHQKPLTETVACSPRLNCMMIARANPATAARRGEPARRAPPK